MKWCDEGIYLLASQPVDKCQAQDGAEAALQEVEKFLETRAENKIQELSKIYQDYEPILTQDLLVRGQPLTCSTTGYSDGAQRHRAIGGRRAEGAFRAGRRSRAPHAPTGSPPVGRALARCRRCAETGLLTPAGCLRHPAGRSPGSRPGAPPPLVPPPAKGSAGATRVTAALGRCPDEPVTPSPAGARAEGLPEAGERGGDVSPETGEPQEAGCQADAARAAGGPPARGTCEIALPLPGYGQSPLPLGKALPPPSPLRK